MTSICHLFGCSPAVGVQTSRGTGSELCHGSYLPLFQPFFGSQYRQRPLLPMTERPPLAPVGSKVDYDQIYAAGRPAGPLLDLWNLGMPSSHPAEALIERLHVAWQRGGGDEGTVFFLGGWAGRLTACVALDAQLGEIADMCLLHTTF